MKMMLGFVAMVGVICFAADPFSMSENSIMAYEKPRSFLGYDDRENQVAATSSNIFESTHSSLGISDSTNM
jgi:hypothetical protein